MARSEESSIAPNAAVVFMPEQEDRLAALRAADVPRLVVVSAGTEPPTVVDDLEEWIRFPAEPADGRARLEALRARAGRRTRPSLDDDGILRVGAAWVALPANDEKLVEPLLRNFGNIVPTETLISALQGDKTRI